MVFLRFLFTKNKLVKIPSDYQVGGGIKKVIVLSTDKAVYPINTMGMSKAIMEKLAISKSRDPRVKANGGIICATRYGNVMCSRGSVIPFFSSLDKTKPAPITDINMTRFMISLEEGVDLVATAFKESVGGEIYVKKIPSMKVLDIARAIKPDAEYQIIGIRPGEKIHEVMISEEDSMSTYEFDWYFKILPTLNQWHLSPERIKDGKLVKKDFVYSSEKNPKWMSTEQLKSFLHSDDYLELQKLNK